MNKLSKALQSFENTKNELRRKAQEVTRLTTYRFYGRFAAFNKCLASDDEAFDYASGMVDSGSIRIEKFTNGVWFAWSMDGQAWVHCKWLPTQAGCKAPG